MFTAARPTKRALFRCPKLPHGISATFTSLLLAAGLLTFTEFDWVRGAQQPDAIDDAVPAPLAPSNGQSPAQASPSSDALARLQSLLNTVDSSDPATVAKALGAEFVSKFSDISDSPVNVLSSLSDPDGSTPPELLLKWWFESAAGNSVNADATTGAGWSLFLITKDQGRWHLSPLLDGSETFDLELVKLSPAGKRALAVTLYHGETQVPYPLIFKISDGPAKLIWDGRSDDTLYKGYDFGRVELRDAGGEGSAQMVVTGREDPGLLVFPKESQRGFAARTTYTWNGKAFVPAKVEYSRNPDYTLYRFISALHLHDFKGAYALIEPKSFLGDEEPSLEKFKKHIEDSWPEFLDDQIFEALVTGTALTDYTFALPESPKHYVYHPEFSADGTLIVHLKRREGK